MCTLLSLELEDERRCERPTRVALFSGTGYPVLCTGDDFAATGISVLRPPARNAGARCALAQTTGIRRSRLSSENGWQFGCVPRRTAKDLMCGVVCAHDLRADAPTS